MFIYFHSTVLLWVEKAFCSCLQFLSLAVCYCRTLVLVPLSNMFNVYAADNCDATSTCTSIDLGSLNSQTNNCRTNSDCINTAYGNSNSNTNNCSDSASCDNNAVGNLNILTSNCRTSHCNNVAIGDSNTQNSNCIDSNCARPIPEAEGNSNTQNKNCRALTRSATHVHLVVQTLKTLIVQKTLMFSLLLAKLLLMVIQILKI